MNAHPAVDLLSAWVDGELPARERPALEQHLAGCDPCRGRVADFQRLAAALRGLESSAPPADLGATVMRLAVAEARGTRRRHWSTRVAPAIPPQLMMGFAVLAALSVAVVWFAVHAAGGPRAPASASARVGSVAPGREATLVRREWVHRQGGWVELGVDPSAVSRRLPGDAGEVAAMTAEIPGLRRWLERGEGVVLRWRGETIELLPVSPRGAPAQR